MMFSFSVVRFGLLVVTSLLECCKLRRFGFVLKKWDWDVGPYLSRNNWPWARLISEEFVWFSKEKKMVQTEMVFKIT